jgi:hypothetical protein
MTGELSDFNFNLYKNGEAYAGTGKILTRTDGITRLDPKIEADENNRDYRKNYRKTFVFRMFFWR